MARGFGTTFGSGTSDSVAGGSNITVGNQVSISVWIWRNGTGGSGLGQIFNIGDAAATNYMSFYNNSTSNLHFNRAWSGSSGGEASWSIALPGDSAWVHYLISYNGNSTGNSPIINKNGASVGVTTVTAPSGSISTITRVPTIGNDS